MYTLAYLVFLAYVFFVLVRPQDFMPAFLNTQLMLVSLLLSSLFWLASASKNKNFQPPQYKLLLFMVMLVFISCVGYDGFRASFDKMFNFFIIIWALIVCGNVITSAKRTYGFIVLAVISTSIMAYHAIDQNQTGVGFTGITTIEGRARYVGIFEDPNDLGLILVASIPFIGLGISASKSLIIKLCLISLMALHLYGIYLTDSRGTMLGLLGVMCFYGILRFGTLKGGFLGLLFLPLVIILAPSRFSEIDADEASAHGRVDAWYEGLDMFQSSPIWGVGYKNFTEYNTLTAHNSYILALAELGFAGFFIWISFITITCIMVYKLYTSSDETFGIQDELEHRYSSIQQVKSLSLTLAFSFLGILITCFFISRTYILPLYIYFGLAIGLYTGVRRQWADFPTVNFKEWIGKFLILSVCLVMSFYVMVKFLL